MTHRRLPILLTLTALVCVMGACSVSPYGKTKVLRTPAPPVAETAAPPDTVGLKKVSTIDLGKLDTIGYFYGGMPLVYGWLDNDHLAAIGTKPVVTDTDAPTASPEEQKVLREKYLYAKRVNASGIVGQILSVDWKTDEATELYTVQDSVITGMGLSHDKSKLWYMSSDGQAVTKLSVTDISFKHAIMDIQQYVGSAPAWSSLDKYLYYIDYPKEKNSYAQLMLFDGVSTVRMPYEELSMGGINVINVIGVDDEHGVVMSVVKNSAVVSVPLPQAADAGAVQYDGERIVSNFINKKEPVSSYIYSAVWPGGDYTLMLRKSKESESESLGILEIASGKQPYWYDGVANFALSDDGRYICLVRQSSGNSADICIAEWKNGEIKNETTLFKGFSVTERMYFSPDNTKLYVQGRYNTQMDTTTAMVLQFR